MELKRTEENIGAAGAASCPRKNSHRQTEGGTPALRRSRKHKKGAKQNEWEEATPSAADDFETERAKTDQINPARRSEISNETSNEKFEGRPVDVAQLFFVSSLERVPALFGLADTGIIVARFAIARR